MIVKCFTAEEKDHIVRQYQGKTLNIKEIASFWFTSPRTIGRVLEEKGIATPVPRLKGEAYQVMRLLKSHGIPSDKLDEYLFHVAPIADQEETARKYLANLNKKDAWDVFWDAWHAIDAREKGQQSNVAVTTT